MVLRAADQERGNARLRIEALLRRLVADDLDRADEADAARVADQRMIGVAADAGLHSRADAAHLRDDVALLVDLQRLERDRRGHRMRRVRVAVAEDAELVALREQDLVERVRDEVRRDRQVAGRQRLRDA